MTATDKATEVVADVADEVSEQASNVADVARTTDSGRVALAIGAFLLGAGVGGGGAYIFAKRQLETKYSKIADEEIAEMREHYQAKARALEAEAAKRPMEDIVREQGYGQPSEEEPGPSAGPPMAVQPPKAVVDADAPVYPSPKPEAEPEVHNVFTDHGDPETTVPVEHDWDYQAELKKRSPDAPYVIHYDERDEMDDYQVVTVTYYEGDDVVCDERDSVIDEEERNRLIGEQNLNRFGHGSNDPNVVYVRNDSLQLIYEVCKSPNSYAEEVHGFRHGDVYRGNLERMRARERFDAEED